VILEGFRDQVSGFRAGVGIRKDDSDLVAAIEVVGEPRLQRA
jgi:hypothetical protein